MTLWGKNFQQTFPSGLHWNEPDPYRRKGTCNPWIQDCLQIWSRSQMQLRSGLAVAVAGSCSCSANSTIARAFPNAMGLPWKDKKRPTPHSSHFPTNKAIPPEVFTCTYPTGAWTQTLTSGTLWLPRIQAHYHQLIHSRLTHSPWARPQPYRNSRPGFQNTHTSPMRFLCFQTHTPTSGIPPNTYYRSPRTSNTHTATIRLHVLIHMYTSQTPMDTHRQIFPTLEHTDAPNTRHGATSPEDNRPAPPPTETQKDTAHEWV